MNLSDGRPTGDEPKRRTPRIHAPGRRAASGNQLRKLPKRMKREKTSPGSRAGEDAGCAGGACAGTMTRRKVSAGCSSASRNRTGPRDWASTVGSLQQRYRAGVGFMQSGSRSPSAPTPCSALPADVTGACRLALSAGADNGMSERAIATAITRTGRYICQLRTEKMLPSTMGAHVDIDQVAEAAAAPVRMSVRQRLSPEVAGA